VADDPENMFGILMVSVIAPFVLNPEENQKAASHTDGQPGDIDKSITLMSGYAAEGRDDVIAYHDGFSRNFHFYE